MPTTVSRDSSKEVAAAIPYFVFQKHHEDDVLIITTLERTLTSEDIQEAKRGAIICGDVIKLTQRIALSGRDLTIHARIIEVHGEVVIDSSAEAMLLTYSGHTAAPHSPETLPGTSGKTGNAGAHGKRGQNAGNLTLVAQKIELPDGSSLTLTARGTDGQSGQSGGNGSDGVAGADGKPREEILIRCVDGTKGQDGGNGGNGGRGGDAGAGGSGGVITVRTVEPFSATRLRMYTDAGANGAPGAGGSGAAGKPGGKGGGTWKSVEKSFWKKLITSSASRFELVPGPDLPNGANGANGADGMRGELMGSPAMAGTSTIATLISQDFLGRIRQAGTGAVISDFAADSLFAPNLEQLYLMLAKAKRLYLSAENRATFEQALAALAWIYYVTPTPDENAQRVALARKLAALQADPALLDPALTPGISAEDDRKLEAGRRLRALIGFARHVITEAAEWEALHVRAGVLLCQLSEGLDFYGRPWNWAPSIQIDPLVQHAKRLLSAGESVESLFLSYQRQAAEQDKWQAQLTEALDTHEKLLRDVNPKLTAVIRERQGIEQEYPALARDVFAKEVELRTACDAFVTDLKRALTIDAGKDLVKTAAAIYTMGSGVSEAWTVASAAMEKVKEREPAKPGDSPAEALAAPIKNSKPVEIEMVSLRRPAAEHAD